MAMKRDTSVIGNMHICKKKVLLSTEEIEYPCSSKLCTPDQTLLDTREFTTIATFTFTTLVDRFDGSKLLLLLLKLLALLDTRVAHVLLSVRRETLVLLNRIRDGSLAIGAHLLLLDAVLRELRELGVVCAAWRGSARAGQCWARSPRATL